MKKALSIILIFTALTNIVGFMPFYFSFLQEVKNEVKLKISTSSDLQQLQVSEAEYNDPAVFRITDEAEFSFKGRMYDFKTMKKTDNGYVFCALEDNKEAGLIDFIKIVYGPNECKNNKVPLDNLLKNFSKDFVGSFSKQITWPVADLLIWHIFLAANETCSGYCHMAQNPPDIAG